MSPDTDLEEIRKELIPKLTKIAMIMVVSNVVLVIGLIAISYMGMTKKPLSFAVTSTGQITPIVPLNEALLSDSRILGFSDECVRQAFSHDFKNFRSSMANSKECFTPAGSRGFDAAISPLLEDIQARRMVMSVSLEPAVIVQASKPRGVHTWIVQVKMVLFREGTKERVVPTTYVVDLVVERVPIEESPRRVGIAQINVRPAPAT